MFATFAYKHPITRAASAQVARRLYSSATAAAEARQQQKKEVTIISQENIAKPSLSTSNPNYITPELLRSFGDREHTVNVLKPDLKQDFLLQSGVSLPKEAIQIKYATFGKAELGKPILLLCPSMSNSVHAMDAEGHKGWWRGIMGKGSAFGIDIEKFFVICGAPLGSPFGSTSPITINPATGQKWGPAFPQITPKDQANLQRLLLSALGVNKVMAVVGGSMGGMQTLQFAVNFPQMYDTFASIASTAQTSPGIVALRSVQREAVRLDPGFKEGHFDEKHPPKEGLRLARMMGTIFYRSHREFLERFNWQPKEHCLESVFEVEEYLRHQGNTFIDVNKYDANCWLLNSKSMDLQDIGANKVSFQEALARIPSSKKALLLSYATDRLTPPEDQQRVSKGLDSLGVENHFEILDSKYGHDAFLIEREAHQLNVRLKAFLEGAPSGAVERMHHLLSEVHYP